MRNQKGFTLIELIIVIVVLGILAVTAAPQFIDFSSDARTSTLKGVEGSIKAANQVVLSRASIDGKLTGEDSVTVKGNTVNTIFGYIKASSLKSALDVSANDFWFVEKTAADYAFSSGTTLTTQGVYYIAPRGAVTAATDPATATEVENSNCYITYTDPADDSSAPSIAITDDGC